MGGGLGGGGGVGERKERKGGAEVGKKRGKHLITQFA